MKIFNMLFNTLSAAGGTSAGNDIDLAFEPGNFVKMLPYMGKGMVVIFAIIAVIIIATVIINKVFSNK